MGEEYNAMHLATVGGHVPMLEWLLQHGFTIDTESLIHQYTPIKFATELSLVQWFSENGADINSGAHTPLQESAAKGNMEIIRWLTVNGAQIDVKNRYGYTALHLATEAGNQEAVQFLISKGASVRELAGEGRNLLHNAAISGNLQLVEYVIEELGFSVLDTDSNGDTPLLCAATNYHMKVIEFLLAYGAELEHKNNKGSTIFTISKERGFEEELNNTLSTRRIKNAKMTE